MTTQPLSTGGLAPVVYREPGGLSTWWNATLSFTRKKPLGAFGGAIVVLLVLLAIGAPVISPYGPLENNQAVALKGPSLTGIEGTFPHLAGTDQFGRDVFSRVVYGAQTSLYIGVLVTLVSTLPALALGVSSAYFGGWVDYLLQRFVDTVQAVPYLILLIAIMVVLGPSFINVVFALSFRRAVTESRVLRGATLSLMNQTYVEAARAMGATDTRVMLRHLVPNLIPLLIVLSSTAFAGVILSEASLSFLGYGVPPPRPSWGGMLAADGRAFMYAAPWMLIAPTLALAIVVFGVNMFGDALRDVLDPRLRGAR
ncbi:MAG: ABC transporter permease [Dehalococcoidia bacterium]|nr:ABC transporter permease [Dehalococcoidia bacterium]